MTPVALNATDARYPARLRERPRVDAPAQLSALGNLDLLALPKTVLFCSVRCPGDVILRTHDRVARWRGAGRCVISSFHSCPSKGKISAFSYAENRLLSSAPPVV